MFHRSFSMASASFSSICARSTRGRSRHAGHAAFALATALSTSPRLAIATSATFFVVSLGHERERLAALRRLASDDDGDCDGQGALHGADRARERVARLLAREVGE